ncbi:MAG: hypothetical protein JNM84_09305 [Planctomycetes bacterium]|nr:hypothetical protein [Planctomycetota bacterium]
MYTSHALSFVRGGLLALLAGALAGCPIVFTEGGSSSARIGAARAKIPGSRAQRSYISMRTTAEANGVGYVRPPYDLWGSFAVETTCGVYDPELFDATHEGRAVFQLDARGPSPLEFYGLGAQVFSTPQRGINVYVQTHLGIHGALFFPGAERIDFRIESNGTALFFLAREAGEGNFVQVDTRTIATPSAPLNARLGFAGLGREGELGFEFLRVPTNGTPPTPQGAQYDALQRYYDGLFDLQAAAHELNGPSPYPLLADEELGAALLDLEESRTLIAGLSLENGKEPLDIAGALKIVDKTIATTQKLRAKAQRSHSAGSTNGMKQTIQKKLWGPAWDLTDKIITSELRASLPGGL